MIERNLKKIKTSDATAAISLAFLLMAGVLMLAFVCYAIGGLLIAWAWNAFLVPNVEVVPAIVWWQGALGLLGIRFILGLLSPRKVD
jgi:hypothetical protein